MNGYPTIEAKIGQSSIPLAKLKPFQVSQSCIDKHINDPAQIELAIPFYQKGILDLVINGAAAVPTTCFQPTR
jgi:hypothetical protein